MERGLTSSKLYQISSTNAEVRGLVAEDRADVFHLRVLAAVCALAREDDGAVAGSGKAVVEREADGGARIIRATPVAADE